MAIRRTQFWRLFDKFGEIMTIYDDRPRSEDNSRTQQRAVR